MCWECCDTAAAAAAAAAAATSAFDIELVEDWLEFDAELVGLDVLAAVMSKPLDTSCLIFLNAPSSCVCCWFGCEPLKKFNFLIEDQIKFKFKKKL